jgi:hypothetical protein
MGVGIKRGSLPEKEPLLAYWKQKHYSRGDKKI